MKYLRQHQQRHKKDKNKDFFDNILYNYDLLLKKNKNPFEENLSTLKDDLEIIIFTKKNKDGEKT